MGQEKSLPQTVRAELLPARSCRRVAEQANSHPTRTPQRKAVFFYGQSGAILQIMRNQTF
jgi:hypothetical protein